MGRYIAVIIIGHNVASAMAVKDHEVKFAQTLLEKLAGGKGDQ